MTRKKAVKVRKWVTCSEPGCKRRACTLKHYCGEHQKQFDKKIREQLAKHNKAVTGHLISSVKGKVDKKRDRQRDEAVKARRAAAAQPKKPARKKSQKEITAAVKARMKAAAASLSSRLIKAYCEKCGYTIRLSRKWIEVRQPLCPVCRKNMVTGLDLEQEVASLQAKLKGVKKARAKGGV